MRTNYTIKQYRHMKRNVIKQLGIPLTDELINKLNNATTEIQLDNITRDLVRKM